MRGNGSKPVELAVWSSQRIKKTYAVIAGLINILRNDVEKVKRAAEARKVNEVLTLAVFFLSSYRVVVQLALRILQEGSDSEIKATTGKVDTLTEAGKSLKSTLSALHETTEDDDLLQALLLLEIEIGEWQSR